MDYPLDTVSRDKALIKQNINGLYGIGHRFDALSRFNWRHVFVERDIKYYKDYARLNRTIKS
jgi:hypothetical protein